MTLVCGIREVFPLMEEIADHPTKRFHIPKGLDGFFLNRGETLLNPRLCRRPKRKHTRCGGGPLHCGTSARLMSARVMSRRTDPCDGLSACPQGLR